MPPSLFTASASTAQAASPRRSTGGGGGGLFGITCGCKDSKAAKVPGSSPTSSCSYTNSGGTNSSSASRNAKIFGGRAAKPDSLAAIITTPSPSSSGANTPVLRPLRPHGGGAEVEEDRRRSSCSTPSFSGLLKQLVELEKSVRAWESRRRRRNRPQPPCVADQTVTTQGRDYFCRQNSDVSGCTAPVQRSSSSIMHRAATPSRRHRRCTSEGVGRGGAAAVDAVAGRGNIKSNGAVSAVIKETADPVGDFRRSMVSVIADEGIATEEGLRTLLARFLAINPPENHPLALRAFALVWDDIFSPSSARQDDCLTCEVATGGNNYCDQIQYQYQYYY